MPWCRRSTSPTAGGVWRFDTTKEDDDSTNVGGGLAVEQGTLYAVNGLAELVALDAGRGTVRWRSYFGAPTRSAPTVVEGRLFVTTIEDRLLALAADDGRQLWSHQAANATTSILGRPAPAYADGLVVAGFGSGELATLRAESGDVVWTDTLASTAVRTAVWRISPRFAGCPWWAMGGSMRSASADWWSRTICRSAGGCGSARSSGEDRPWAAGRLAVHRVARAEDGAVHRDDGRVAWVTELPRWENPEKQKDPITWFGPLLVGDRLVVAGTNQEALAVSPYTGEILGQQELSGRHRLDRSWPAARVFVVTDDGRLLALR